MRLILWKYCDSNTKPPVFCVAWTPQTCSQSCFRNSLVPPLKKNKQPDNWQAALLDVWWNKCILICAETWLWKADLQPNCTSKLWGGIFFLCLSFSFLSPWQAHFSSPSRTAAGGGIITLHYITEHSIMGAQSNNFHARCRSITCHQ